MKITVKKEIDVEFPFYLDYKDKETGTALVCKYIGPQEYIRALETEEGFTIEREFFEDDFLNVNLTRWLDDGYNFCTKERFDDFYQYVLKHIEGTYFPV